MNIPGFTANASLYKPSRYYYGGITADAAASELLISLQLLASRPRCPFWCTPTVEIECYEFLGVVFCWNIYGCDCRLPGPILDHQAPFSPSRMR